MTQKGKDFMGWAIWICTVGILFWLGEADFQIRHMNSFVVIIIVLSLVFVIGFSLLYGRAKKG